MSRNAVPRAVLCRAGTAGLLMIAAILFGLIGMHALAPVAQGQPSVSALHDTTVVEHDSPMPDDGTRPHDPEHGHTDQECQSTPVAPGTIVPAVNAPFTAWQSAEPRSPRIAPYDDSRLLPPHGPPSPVLRI